ncbi:NACHT, LRR and PYD domains-containing protein 12 isoform X2 [Bombina bombina]|uniref:NACHT, LRR and PYD domains-containing protein 12 isoform X2 n=1 Tax=Bombina bombina TaxID=8345 RepID=UPI00235ABE46|nr:NACHT, LRR and PYD domains-containing protein 12 isoform X2 [Bombina bombina]
MMKTLDDILYYHLSNLSSNDFKRFNDKLSDFHFCDKPPIPRGRLLSLDIINTKNTVIDVYGEDALNVVIQVLQHIGLEGCADKVKKDICANKLNHSKNLEDCKKKYMEFIITKYKRIQDHNARLGETVNLAKRYTSLLMITKYRNEEERTHELTSTGKKHLKLMDERASDEYSKTSIETLFDSKETPINVILQGPAGIGKTMTVQKIMLNWASGTLYQDIFMFAFSISCREINGITGEISMVSLISKFCNIKCSENLKSILENSKKILLIIDGFDEFKWILDKDTGICSDPFQETSVEILLNSILRKHVLEEATIIVTTRPYALERLNECVHFDRYVEVLGFTENDRKDYFYNFFEKKEQAEMALDTVIENDILFTMCCVPITCWIVCTVLKLQIQKDAQLANSKTTTSIYTLYLKSLIKYHGREFNQSLLSRVKKLCALAKYGVCNKTILFEEEDISNHGLTGSEIEALFLNENVFQRDVECHTCYSFIHLSIQEFFAALYYVLLEDTETNDHSGNPLSYKEVFELIEKNKKLSTLTLTIRFMYGLSGKEQTKEIERIFGCKMSKGTKSALADWITKSYCKRKIFFNPVDELTYLYETQEEEFVRSMMGLFLRLEFSELDETELSFRAISYCFVNSPRDDHEVSFKSCYMSRKLCKILFPALIKCTVLVLRYCDLTQECCEDLCWVINRNKSLINLDLGMNNLEDTGLKLLCDALANRNCPIQELRLYRCGLTSASCGDLSLILIKNKCLINLDLGENALFNKGMKLLSEGLMHPDCMLQELKLSNCKLSAISCKDISSVCVTNNSLITLDLCNNSLDDVGVKFLHDGLTHPNCTLRHLRLYNCDLTSSSCEYFNSVIVKNKSLLSLDLGNNDLEDAGLRLLCDGLTEPNCILQELKLDSCGLTSASCEDLSSVFSNNTSLINLHLNRNRLLDSGVKALCVGLKHPNCVLQDLRLPSCNLTSSCCEDLGSVIRTNKSLIALNLRQNVLNDAGMQHLYDALCHENCHLQQLRLNGCGLKTGCDGILPSILILNRSLIKLDFRANLFLDSVQKCFYEGLRNPDCTLQKLGLVHEMIDGNQYRESFGQEQKPETEPTCPESVEEPLLTDEDTLDTEVHRQTLSSLETRSL